MRGHVSVWWSLVPIVALLACHAVGQDDEGGPDVRPPAAALAPDTFSVTVEAAGKGVQATPQLLATLSTLIATDLAKSGLQPPPNVSITYSMNASVAQGCRAYAPSAAAILQSGDDEGSEGYDGYTQWTQDTKQKASLASADTSLAGKRRRLHTATPHKHAALNVHRRLTECEDASAAVVTMLLGVDASEANSTYVQNQTNSLFWSGLYLSDVKASLPAVEDLELLTFQAPGEEPVEYETSEEWGYKSGGWPTLAAPAESALAPNQPNITVSFDLVVVGPSAQLTNDFIVNSLYSALLGMLTPVRDFVTAQNAVVTKVQALPNLTASSLGTNSLSGSSYSGRRLLSRESMGRALAALPASQSAPPSPSVSNQAIVSIVPAAAPSSSALSPAAEPQPAMRVSFRIINITADGEQLIYDQLAHIMDTQKLLNALQDSNVLVYGISLQNFSPNPTTPPAYSPPVYYTPPVLPVPILPDPQKGPKPHGMPSGYIVLAVVLPVASLVIGIALAFGWHRIRAQKRRRDIEARGSSDSEAVRNKRLLGQLSSNDRFTVDGVIAKMESGPKLSAAEALLAVPWNDWEISDPDDIEILKRKDGSEWMLGAGASGRVYKAQAGGLQTVAVKIFTDQAREEACSGEKVAEFRREIAILKGCRDRNIVQFIGACLQEGRTILVTEYMENGDLYNAIANSTEGNYGWYRRLQANGKPAPGTGLARRVALDVARGLAFLHDRKVVHFDLKSANILLARDLTAKIADVGLAKILHKEYLSSLRAVGTFAWAAPEVLLGHQCSEKVDIYSYGVLLWELSAGEAPAGRQLRKLRVPEEVPPEIEDLMLRCLDTDPSVRPSARQIVEQLAALRLPPRAVPSPSSPESSSRQPNNPFGPLPPQPEA